MTFADDIGMPPLGLVFEVIIPLIGGCIALGVITWYNAEKKKKQSKKLSKKQKREAGLK